jgi:hypothetical protein
VAAGRGRCGDRARAERDLSVSGTRTGALTRHDRKDLQVAGAVVRGVEAVDVRLRERVPPAQIEAMRSVLAFLAEIATASTDYRDREGAAARQFRRVGSPVQE